MCVASILVLGTSRLIPLRCVGGLTWAPDSFPFSPSSSPCPYLIVLLSLSFSIAPCLFLQSVSGSFYLFVSTYCISLRPLSGCKSWVGVRLSLCFLMCVTCFSLNTGHKSLTSLQPLSKAL